MCGTLCMALCYMCSANRECGGRGFPQEVSTHLKKESRLGVNQVKRAVHENSPGKDPKVVGNRPVRGTERGPTFSDM